MKTTTAISDRATVTKPPLRGTGDGSLRVEGETRRAVRSPESAARQPAGLFRRAMPRPGGTKRLQQLAAWARQLYVLVHTGTPLAQALHAVERQVTSATWGGVLADLRRQLDEGHSLSDGMERHPEYFNAVSRSLVAAGESSGQLDAMLDRVARLLRQQLRVQRSLIGSLVYPCLLVVLAVVVICSMMGFVLPRFTVLFETLNAPLPPSTKVLIAMSDVLRGQWILLILGAAAAVVGARLFQVSDAGRRQIDAWIIRLPSIGRIVRAFETARIARLLGSLVQSKVPLLDAMRLTRRSCTNGRYRELMDRASDAVTRGRSMTTVFAEGPLISPSVTEAIRHGEASGQIGVLLLDMADLMDEENEVVIKSIMSIVEPVILILLGVVVAFIALSMFVPLFDLTAMTQGGGG